MEINQSTVLAQAQGEDAHLPARRINAAFARAKQEGRGVFIPYFMAGYPSAPQSVELIVAAIESGADIIEIGIPFSDPLADGATVQHAGQKALEQGMTIKGCLQVAQQVSARTTAPLLFMGYYNPILSYGITRFCADARDHGICGLIIPDLPYEEADILQKAAHQHGLSLIYLIPPTTPEHRIAHIAQRTRQQNGGFVYCVSLSGVTGSREKLPPHLQSFITRVQRHTQEIPLAVGFGLSTPEHIAAITQLVEGAVVGSALVNLIDRHQESEQVEAVQNYVKSLIRKP